MTAAWEPWRVHPIADDTHAHATRVCLDLRQYRWSSVNLGPNVTIERSNAHFAPRAECRADVKAKPVLACLVLGDPIVIDKNAACVLADLPIGSAKQPPARFERLIELAEQIVVLPHLGFCDELAAKPIDPGAAIADQCIEVRVALKVRRKAETEAQIIRADLFFVNANHQRTRAGSLLDPVIDRVEIAAPIDAAQIGSDLVFGQFLARF